MMLKNSKNEDIQTVHYKFRQKLHLLPPQKESLEEKKKMLLFVVSFGFLFFCWSISMSPIRHIFLYFVLLVLQNPKAKCLVACST